MPLTEFICQVPTGCNLFVPGNPAGTQLGFTNHLTDLPAQLAIPSVSAQGNPGNAAIRVTAGNPAATWYVWSANGMVLWMGPGGVQHAPGLPSNAQRTFEVLLVNQVMTFAIT